MEGVDLESVELKEIVSGYRERMRRLALFDPLFDLDRKRETDRAKTPIDMKGLGLLTLLFFFEQKLMRQYKTGVHELSHFLQQLTSEQYQLDSSDYERIARTIIQTFRPTSGRKRSYDFYNWETTTYEQIEYSILKANNFDLATNSQYYTLDDDGLELVFATKEFYSEFQLSINQLMLRKQLEKGEFKGALRQINEMRIDVENLQERMVKLKQEILRSIVSEETFERYKQLLDDIYSRLEREDEEFKELRQFVKETRDRLFSKDIHKKEVKTYELVIRINSELESVHYEHSRLLEQTFTLKDTTLVTAQESLYYIGIQAFNFDQDLVSPIISNPLSLDAMVGILHPFLKVEENKSWSPLTLFAEQNIIEESKINQQQSFIEANQNEHDDPYRQALIEQYKKIMQYYLDAVAAENVHTLSRFMDYLDGIGQSTLYENRCFYDFWLVLHQRSPIIHGKIEEEEDGKTLLGEALRLLGERTLSIIETKKIIQRVKRYSIQEMMIQLEEAEDAIS